MLPSLLPVGVSHRRPLHPQSFIALQAGQRVVVEFCGIRAHSTGDPLPATGRVACDGIVLSIYFEVYTKYIYDSSSSPVTAHT